MATVLHNCLSFTGLVVNVPSVQAHGLQIDHDSAGVVALTPQLTIPDRGPFTVAVDATNVTVTRTADSPGDTVNVWVQWEHTINQVWPRTGLPAALPHIVRPGRITGGNGTFLNVADLTELGNYDVTTIADGSVAYVRDHDDLYTLTKTGGPYTPDALGVIAGNGGGYWIAQMQGRWGDLRGSAAQGKASAALTLEAYRDTAFQMYFFRHDQDDTLDFEFQMPHRWRKDTAVRPHLHVVPMVAPAADENCYFTGYYTWAPFSFSPIPLLAGWTTFTATLTVTPTDAFRHMIVTLGTFNPPANPTESTMLLIHVVRAGTNLLDTYDTNKVGGTVAANLGLLSADVHYRKEHFGSITEYV